MPKLVIVDQSGAERAVEAAVGRTVMEVIRDNGFDELLALCGGCCSCATFPVFPAPAFADSLPKMGEDEADLLDRSSHRGETSRRSGQHPGAEPLDGMK